MRAGIVAVVPFAIAAGGCSLLLSTSDLEGGDAAAPDAATPSDGALGDAFTTSDVVGDAGAEEAAVADPSLVGYWPLDTVNGSTAPDMSGHGHDMSLSGAVFDPSAGVRGGALTFMGGAASAVVGSLSGGSFPLSGTLSIWVKRTFVDETSSRSIFDDWDSTRAHLFIRWLGTSQGGAEVQVALQPAMNDYSWAESFSLAKDAWAHVVLTWDANAKAAALWVDGALVSSTAFVNVIDFTPAAQEFRLGKYFEGALDEIRLYDRALSPTEAMMIP